MVAAKRAGLRRRRRVAKRKERESGEEAGEGVALSISEYISLAKW